MGKDKGKDNLIKLKMLKKASKQEKKLVHLNTSPTLKDVDPDKVLAQAFGELDDVILAGYKKDGSFYFCSSVADGGTVLWLIEHLKMKLIGTPTGEYEDGKD